MRTDITPSSSRFARPRDTGITVWPITESPAEVLIGTATGGIAWSNYVVAMSGTDAAVRITLQLPRDIDPPVPGQVITVFDSGPATQVTVFNGIVDGVETESARGVRTHVVTLRRRDATPMWRDQPRVSEAFAAGTDLGAIAARVAEEVVTEDEHDMPGLGVRNPIDSAQMAQLSAWEMLRRALEPALREPFVDALGKLKAISRDIRRPADITLTEAEVISVARRGAGAGPTAVRVRYVAAEMVEVAQAYQLLAKEAITTGFFRQKARKEVWFSPDKTLRAKDLRMRTVTSVIGAVSPDFVLNTEEFQPYGDTGGVIVIDTAGPNAAVLSDLVAETASAIMEMGSGILGGIVNFFSDPEDGVGQIIDTGIGGGLSKITNLLKFSAVGEYEIWGTPYDYVHQVNETEAYDDSAPAWAARTDSLESMFVGDEERALSLARGELLYRARAAANPAELVILDRYEIEPGDLLEVPDEGRFYVVPGGISRDLTRNAPAHVALRGFFV